jgi:hypothetical protein
VPENASGSRLTRSWSSDCVAIEPRHSHGSEKSELG